MLPRFQHLGFCVVIAALGLTLSIGLLPCTLPVTVLWAAAMMLPWFCGRNAALLTGAAFVPGLAGLENCGLLPGPDLLWLWFAGLLAGTGLQAALTRAEATEAVSAAATNRSARLALWLIGALALLLLGSFLRALPAGLAEALHPPGSRAYDSPHYASSTMVIWLLGLGAAAAWVAWGTPSRGALVLFSVLNVAAILGFATIQWRHDLPAALVVWVGRRALAAPYEDIHSLAGVAAALLAGLVALLPVPSRRAAILVGGAVAGLATVLIAAWSRSAWLAAGLFMGFSLLLRLPRRGVIAATVLAAAMLVAGHYGSKTEAWNRNPYLWRLGALIRLENPANKDPSRVSLWGKAVAMIAERPLLGHGPGSFRSQAPRFARAGDPYGSDRDFAHNSMLQFAAETGLPATALLLAVLGIALARGIRLCRRASPTGRIPAALTFSLGTYVLTQLTANSLNIYSSNQFFFWFLVAALLTWPEPAADKAT